MTNSVTSSREERYWIQLNFMKAPVDDPNLHTLLDSYDTRSEDYWFTNEMFAVFEQQLQKRFSGGIKDV